MKEIIDIIHKSIYPFFDVCKEGEEPLSDKDKLLLEVNKTICNNLKALLQEPNGGVVSRDVFEQVRWERDAAIEQLKELGYSLGEKIEPCEDAISRQAVLDIDYNRICVTNAKPSEMIRQQIISLPSVKPQRRSGHWIRKPLKYASTFCSECGYELLTIYKNFCPHCGADMRRVSE